MKPIPERLVAALQASTPQDQRWWALTDDDPNGPIPDWADEMVSGFALLLETADALRLASLALMTQGVDGGQERVGYLMITTELFALGTIEPLPGGQGQGAMIRAMPFSALEAVSISGATGSYRTSRPEDDELFTMSLAVWNVGSSTTVTVGAPDETQSRWLRGLAPWLTRQMGSSRA